MQKNAIMIDGNSLLHRAFYALPPTMKTKAGAPTNAVYGFLTMLFHVIEEYHPSYLFVAFDVKGGTFRHARYTEYKAGRVKTPEELISQFPLLKEALSSLGITYIECKGFEADDILGTMASRAEQEGIFPYIVTGDRDALQLVSQNTNVVLTKKGVSEIELFSTEHFKEVYEGLEPKQMIDLKGLMGDASDHIPGIPGVGEKTAIKLLKEYNSVENLYENMDSLPNNKMKEKIIAGEESARMSKELATIERNAPVAETVEETAFFRIEDEALTKTLTALEFRSLLKRFHLEEKKEAQAVLEVTAITKKEELLALEANILAAGEVFLFFEADALFLALPKEEREYRIPFSSSLFEELTIETVLLTLKTVLESETIKKTIHAAKPFLHILSAYGICFKGLSFDTEIAEYVINPNKKDYSLERLQERYEAQGKAYAVETIAAHQREKIEKEGLETVFYEIELPLISVLFQMEKEGFRIDENRLKALKQSYEEKIFRLTQEIYECSGEVFNIASPKQLGEVLFEKLGLPAKKKTKTGYSTNAEVLEELVEAHPVIEKIMEYRQLTKLKSTYIDGLLAQAGSEGKIHTTFNQTATATGRISSVEPNLQNIPVKSPLSKEIREVFLPGKTGNLIVSADYSQIELRVLSHIAEDKCMQDAFLQEEDIHTRTASEVFGVELTEVTPEMRSSAKAVNFGIVYGISDFGLARNLKIPKFMAERYITRYLEEFSGIKRYMNEIVLEAKEKGKVRTMFGRVRQIDELKSTNFNMRSFGERIAMNTPIQGTAADIIKIAMVSVAKRLNDEGLASKLILQVHDELIVDTEPDETEKVKSILKEEMEHAASLAVPLKVNIESGANWAEAK